MLEGGDVAEESVPLTPVKGFLSRKRELRKGVDIDFPHLQSWIGGRQVWRLRFHIHETAFRLGLDEAVAADRTVGNRNTMKHEVAVVTQFLAARVKENQRDPLSAELGKRAPVDRVGFMRLRVRAIDDERSRFILDVADERVLVGEVPVSQECQEAEEIEIPFERHASRGFVHEANGVRQILQVDGAQVG